MKHVVIVPAYNEADYIVGMLRSLMQQTEPPDRVIVVDDSSTDATAELAEELSKRYPAIEVVRGGPGRGRSYRVVEVFNHGYRRIADQPYRYVSKLDADMILPENYFERLFAVMDSDTSIGAGSGSVFEMIKGKRTRYRLPENHVPGMLKTYRKTAFDAMGGFITTLGWDVIDLVALRQAGFRSINLPELETLHRRRHGSATGIVRGNVRMGRGAYLIGTHPLFMLGRSVYRMLEPPYVLGGAALGWGYLLAWITRTKQIDRPDLRNALKKEQIHRLFNRNRLA